MHVGTCACATANGLHPQKLQNEKAHLLQMKNDNFASHRHGLFTCSLHICAAVPVIISCSSVLRCVESKWEVNSRGSADKTSESHSWNWKSCCFTGLLPPVLHYCPISCSLFNDAALPHHILHTQGHPFPHCI